MVTRVEKQEPRAIKFGERTIIISTVKYSTALAREITLLRARNPEAPYVDMKSTQILGISSMSPLLATKSWEIVVLPDEVKTLFERSNVLRPLSKTLDPTRVATGLSLSGVLDKYLSALFGPFDGPNVPAVSTTEGTSLTELGVKISKGTASLAEAFSAKDIQEQLAALTLTGRPQDLLRFSSVITGYLMRLSGLSVEAYTKQPISMVLDDLNGAGGLNLRFSLKATEKGGVAYKLPQCTASSSALDFDNVIETITTAVDSDSVDAVLAAFFGMEDAVSDEAKLAAADSHLARLISLGTVGHVLTHFESVTKLFEELVRAIGNPDNGQPVGGTAKLEAVQSMMHLSAGLNMIPAMTVLRGIVTLFDQPEIKRVYEVDRHPFITSNHFEETLNAIRNFPLPDVISNAFSHTCIPEYTNPWGNAKGLEVFEEFIQYLPNYSNKELKDQEALGTPHILGFTSATGLSSTALARGIDSSLRYLMAFHHLFLRGDSAKAVFEKIQSMMLKVSMSPASAPSVRKTDVVNPIVLEGDGLYFSSPVSSVRDLVESLPLTLTDMIDPEQQKVAITRSAGDPGLYERVRLKHKIENKPELSWKDKILVNKQFPNLFSNPRMVCISTKESSIRDFRLSVANQINANRVFPVTRYVGDHDIEFYPVTSFRQFAEMFNKHPQSIADLLNDKTPSADLITLAAKAFYRSFFLSEGDLSKRDAMTTALERSFGSVPVSFAKQLATPTNLPDAASYGVKMSMVSTHVITSSRLKASYDFSEVDLRITEGLADVEVFTEVATKGLRFSYPVFALGIIEPLHEGFRYMDSPRINGMY